MPTLSKIRSPQRVISLQCPDDQIDLRSLSVGTSRRDATGTILREPYKIRFKYVEGHAVLRSRENSWRVLSKLTIRQNP